MVLKFQWWFVANIGTILEELRRVVVK